MQEEPYQDLPVSEQVKSLVREHFLVKKRTATFLWLGLLIVLEAGILGVAGYGFLSGSFDTLANFAVIAVMLPIFLVAIPLSIVAANFERKIQKQFRDEIRRQLGLEYTSIVDSRSVSGEVFRMGHSPWITNVYSGHYKDFPIRMFRFGYTIGHGKYSETRWLLVREFDCGFPLPEFVLMPKSLPREGPLWKPRNTSRVRLEGNFSDHFDVWIETQHEIEAMVVLEPHVMTLMLDEFPECGFECSGTKFYVFSNRPMPSRVMDFVREQGRVRHLFDEMLPELRQVSRDIVAMKEAFKK